MRYGLLPTVQTQFGANRITGDELKDAANVLQARGVTEGKRTLAARCRRLGVPRGLLPWQCAAPRLSGHALAALARAYESLMRCNY